MRLKTITAPTMGQAMEQIRRECGEDAIIISTESTLLGVKIMAAVDEREPVVFNPGVTTHDLLARANKAGRDHAVPQGRDPIDDIHEALQGHGLPNPLIERLVDAAFLNGAEEPHRALCGAISSVYQFQPLGDQGPVQPIMLVGVPGAGKTMTAAKLATRAVLAGRPTRLITTDIVRAGAVEQLAAFAKILDIPMATAEHSSDLSRSLSVSPQGELVIIDTAGSNPYDLDEMRDLARLVRSVPAEPVLVTAAGGDVLDGIEQARAFAEMGVVRMISTRLDMARRFGGLLAAAEATGLAFSDCSMTPSVADGLTPLDAAALARLLMPTPSSTEAAQPAVKGARR